MIGEKMSEIYFPPLSNILIGYSVSLILGGLIIEWTMKVIRNRSEVLKSKKISPKRDMYLVRVLGLLERAFYTTCIIIGEPAGIAAWLAIKVITRWGDEENRWANISEANIYLIGNLLTVFFGAGGGLLCVLLPK
jgi:hypothetical protein